MTILAKIFRCLCMCIIIQKGSWSPNDNHKRQVKINPNHRAILNNRLKDTKFKTRKSSGKDQNHLEGNSRSEVRFPNEEVCNEKVLDRELLNEEILNEKVLKEKVLNEKALNEKALNEKVLNAEVLNDKVLKEKVIDEKILNEKLLNEKALNEKVWNEKVLNEKVLNEKVQQQKILRKKAQKGKTRRNQVQKEKARKEESQKEDQIELAQKEEAIKEKGLKEKTLNDKAPKNKGLKDKTLKDTFLKRKAQVEKSRKENSAKDKAQEKTTQKVETKKKKIQKAKVPIISGKAPKPSVKTKKDNLATLEAKPEWLKQWTISKGWMHNRSHMLNLGKEDFGEKNNLAEKQDFASNYIAENEKQGKSLKEHQRRDLDGENGNALNPYEFHGSYPGYHSTFTEYQNSYTEYHNHYPEYQSHHREHQSYLEYQRSKQDTFEDPSELSDEDSSVSINNIEDLLSINSNVDTSNSNLDVSNSNLNLSNSNIDISKSNIDNSNIDTSNSNFKTLAQTNNTKSNMETASTTKLKKLNLSVDETDKIEVISDHEEIYDHGAILSHGEDHEKFPTHEFPTNEFQGYEFSDYELPPSEDLPGYEVPTKTSIIVAKNTEDISTIFSQVSQNYRRNFPENYYKRDNEELSLPEVYKERLLRTKNNFILEFLKDLRPKRKKKTGNNCKFTVNKLYDSKNLTPDNFLLDKFMPDNSKRIFQQRNSIGSSHSENYNLIQEEEIVNEQIELDSNKFKSYLENNTITNNISSGKYGKQTYKTNLGKNIGIYNTLNSKTNVHEDPIYECSEDEVSIYNNPIYESTNDVMKRRGAEAFYGFRKNFFYQKNFIPNSVLFRKRYMSSEGKFDSLKYKLKTEKYIIRHIKIRIMLSLRTGKFQKFCRKEVKPMYKQLFRVRTHRGNPSGGSFKEHIPNGGNPNRSSPNSGNPNRCNRGNFLSGDPNGDGSHRNVYMSSGHVTNSTMCDRNGGQRSYVSRMHSEQRRIGNGKSSAKIQNMRYGRLNVLRWLLWEAQTQSEMPALERASNTTLALHYAAARGCLDCVRLLVDSTPELSANTQMDNDVTPVYLAAQEGHLEVLKFLVLEAGGSLYVRAKDGMAPIHAASQMGCLNCVKWMIQDQGVDPNLRDGDGATPLHFAASRGHLDTVRWLLKHGARLSLDKYGKSPINDAAENQQVECLNVLVQHGTTPDYGETEKRHSCSCIRKGEQQMKRGTLSSDCSSCKPSPNSGSNQEPFYLHPPLGSRSLEAAHAPQDGLYINPMNSHRHSISSGSDSSSSSVNGESFYLHNPQEVIYNRVKDLFEASGGRQSSHGQSPLSALTVKVEVHSSSSGAGSDENLSSSDLSERSGDHEHDYEDIYLVREETKQSKDRNLTNRSRSRDSGSHSRSGSASSSNSGCNVIVKLTPAKDKKDGKKTNEFLPKPQKYENFEKLKSIKKDSQESGLSSTPSTLSSEDDVEKTKLGVRHSLPPPKSNNQGTIGSNSRILKRVTSVPVEISPPPPPPLPIILNHGDEDGPRGAEEVEVVEESTVRPVEVFKDICRSMTVLSARRLNSSCSDLTIISHCGDYEDTSNSALPHLVNKQRVLPFIPPSFPGSADSNNLIKPSEYLRSISDKRSSISSIRSSSEYEDALIISEDQREPPSPPAIPGPPPPPLPDSFMGSQNNLSRSSNESTTEIAKKQMQPLAAISIQDLNSVQLRRTDKMIASKTLSAPTRSMSLQCLQSEPYLAQKTDLIAELKMSRDITGIKKLKIEKAKTEESKEKEMYSEITKQYTANNFVEKIPDKDNTGNIIPAWKRQMLAKKAAERARRELEEQLQKEAEEKRLQSIPQWKRQLMAKKEEAENKIRATIYTPRVEDPKTKKHDTQECQKQHQQQNLPNHNVQHQNMQQHNKEETRPGEDINNNMEAVKSENVPDVVSSANHKTNGGQSDEEANIIPWRAQLRKTNSKLNLLD